MLISFCNFECLSTSVQDYCTPKERQRYFARCRLSYLAQSELFGFAKGTKWGIGHYTFIKQATL